MEIIKYNFKELMDGIRRMVNEQAMYGFPSWLGKE